MNHPAEIAGCRVLRLLGRGGMGAVYLAHGHGREVAIKVLHERDPELMARFQVEAEAMAKVQHRNVVGVVTAGAHEGWPYLVLPHCSGGDLRQLLRGRGALPPDDAVALLAELADGLEAIHAAGLVHRDLKPENVLFTEGVPQITDFGLAKVLGPERQSLTETGVLLGTPAYMAPEQLRDARAVDARSDVYALGAIAFEVLSAQAPFAGASVFAIADAVLHGERAAWPAECAAPPGLRAVVDRAMALEPSERYAGAAALAAALRAGPGASARSLAPRALGVLVLLGVGGGAAWALASFKDTAPASRSPAPSASAVVSPRATAAPGEGPTPSRTPWWGEESPRRGEVSAALVRRLLETPEVDAPPLAYELVVSDGVRSRRDHELAWRVLGAAAEREPRYLAAHAWLLTQSASPHFDLYEAAQKLRRAHTRGSTPQIRAWLGRLLASSRKPDERDEALQRLEGLPPSLRGVCAARAELCRAREDPQGEREALWAGARAGEELCLAELLARDVSPDELELLERLVKQERGPKACAALAARLAATERRRGAFELALSAYERGELGAIVTLRRIAQVEPGLRQPLREVYEQERARRAQLSRLGLEELEAEAAEGDPEALRLLGWRCLLGLGADHDPKRGGELLRWALARNSRRAAQDLLELSEGVHEGSLYAALMPTGAARRPVRLAWGRLGAELGSFPCAWAEASAQERVSLLNEAEGAAEAGDAAALVFLSARGARGRAGERRELAARLGEPAALVWLGEQQAKTNAIVAESYFSQAKGLLDPAGVEAWGLFLARDSKRREEAIEHLRAAARVGREQAALAWVALEPEARRVELLSQLHARTRSAGLAGELARLLVSQGKPWTDPQVLRLLEEHSRAPAPDPVLLLRLANLLRVGKGVKRDLAYAFALLQKVERAQRANPKAGVQGALGRAHLLGEGTPRSPEKALPYLERAAKLAHRPSDEALLGDCYQALKRTDEALAAWARASAGGNVSAGLQRAELLVELRRYPEARLELERLLDEDAFPRAHRRAAGQLGLLLCEEGYAERDPVRGAQLLELGRKGSDPRVGYRLGRCYETGEGVEQDLARARVLYRAAARRGSEPARARLRALGEEP